MTNKSVNRLNDELRAEIADRKGLDIENNKDHYAMVNGLVYTALSNFKEQIVASVAGPAKAPAVAPASTNGTAEISVSAPVDATAAA